MISDFIRNRMRLFFAFAMLVMVVAQLVISGVSWMRVQHALNPAMDRKAAVIADSLSQKFARALAFGIPLDRLEGVGEYFNLALRINPDIAWIGLKDDRQTLFEAGTRSAAVTQDSLSVWEKLINGGSAGAPEAIRPVQGSEQTNVRIVVSGDPVFARRQLRDVLFDLAAVMLVSLFIAMEFVRFTLDAYVVGPLGVMRALMERVRERRLDAVGEAAGGPVGGATRALGERIVRLNKSFAVLAAEAEKNVAGRLRDLTIRFSFAVGGIPAALRRPRVADARLFAFLFMFAEGLARPFLPVYVKAFVSNVGAIPNDVAAGLPITVFMLVVALGMPFAGGLSQRLGRRTSFTLGAGLSAAGLLGSGLAVTYYDLLAWRVMDAVGYTVMFMACQDLAIQNSPPDKRAQGMAVFVGGIMAAEICAPAVGGILADRIGDRTTFILSAALIGLVLLMAVNALKGDAGESHRTEQARSTATTAHSQRSNSLLGMLARNHRFLALAVFAGIPAKMLLTGFLFYMVPVFLAELGASRSEIGRVAMIYGVPTLFLTMAFSRIADRWRLHGFMAGAGGLVASMGMLPILFWTDVERVMLAVFALGLGQAMSISPQITLAAKLAEMEISHHGHGPVLGIYRLIERCGSALGPLIFGVLTATLGYADAMAVGGALTAVSVLVFCVVFLVAGVEPDEDDEGAGEGPVREPAGVANATGAA